MVFGGGMRGVVCVVSRGVHFWIVPRGLRVGVCRFDVRFGLCEIEGWR